MPHDFYPFVVEGVTEGAHRDATAAQPLGPVTCPARIAVYDDAAAAPRVVIVDPKDIRSYLEEITQTVTRLSHEQGGTIPFMVIREVVENLIHAYFREPAISILPGGNTIRFSDQGPGIKEKSRAVEFGTTSATEEMKQYIRGVGSGLPYVEHYLLEKGGSLVLEDNIGRGSIVTISMDAQGTQTTMSGGGAPAQAPYGQGGQQAPTQPAQPQGGYPWQSPYPLQAHPYPTQQPTPLGRPQWEQPQQAYNPWPPAPQPRAVSMPPVSERGGMVLSYLSVHDSVGPKELVSAYGYSNSTWSRELKALDAAGLTIKEESGQKRHLTPAARAFLGE